MERSEEFMMVAVKVPYLLHKLQNLLNYERIADMRSNAPVIKAKNELELISRMITDAEEGRITLYPIDSFWEDLLCILSKLEDVIDTISAKTELLRRQKIWNKMMPSFLCVIPRDHSALSNETQRLTTYAKALPQHRPLGPTGATSSHPQPRNVDFLVPDYSDLFIHNANSDELIDQLFQPNKGELDIVIAVTGLAGSGKTFLVKKVSQMKIARLRFHQHAWVNVSVGFEARDFLVDILTQLIRERLDENLQENELEMRLKRFSNENDCLIVVDDVQTTDLNKLSVVLKSIGGRSRLILTTRNQDVAHAASQGRNYIKLQRLTDEESWKLFLKKAQIAENSFNSPELINLQKDILRKCDGSPRAILVLGGLLSTKDLSDWHSVIEHLSTMESRGLSTVMPAVQRLSTADKQALSSLIIPAAAAQENILALSYQYLSSRVQYCFLYFMVFPRAREIKIRRLFHHWHAERLISPLSEEHMVPEDLMKEYVEQLISRNLIEVVQVKCDGRPKTCRMPGSIWDVFFPKAESLGLVHIHNNIACSSEPTRFIRHLVEYAGIRNYPSSDPYMRSLRSCVSFNTRTRDSPNQEIGLFLHNVVSRRGFGFLIKLDLELVYKPVLSETMGKLVLLKHLGLRRTYLDSLPMSVGNLSYLETLDVKHTNIIAFPSSIWKAKRLQYLYLNDFDMFIRMPKGGSLTNLQSLSGLSIDNKSLVIDFLNNSPGIRKLKLRCPPGLVRALADSISQLSDLLYLHLRSIDEFDEPSTLELGAMAEHPKLSYLSLLGRLQLPRNYPFPPNLKVLILSSSNLEQDPMPMLGQLCHLNTLILLGKSYVGQQMACHTKGFPQLHILRLWVLENLEEWIVEEGAMPLLTELDIRRCNRLQQPRGLELITPLKKILLTKMSDAFVANFKRVMVNASGKPIKFQIDP